MDLTFASMGSGSSGNTYLVKSEKTNILVDAGVYVTSIISYLNMLGMGPGKVNGILVSHEHVDHMRGVNKLMERSSRLACYATQGTYERIEEKLTYMLPENKRVIHSGQSLSIGDIQIGIFSLSHDAAEPVGFTLSRNDKKIAIVTDTGCVTDEIREAIAGSDLLVIEANHEKNILLYGRYPYSVKHRILSDKGHLSNEDAAYCISEYLRTVKPGVVPRVLLAHISKENNTPVQAKLTVSNILQEEGYYVGRDLMLDTLDKNSMTNPIYL